MKMYVVESNREGVKEPVEREIINKSMGGTRCSKGVGDEKLVKKDLYKYELDKTQFPYDVNIVEGATSDRIIGRGTGWGDLWSWTYFYSTDKQEALDYFYVESNRVFQKYLTKKFIKKE